MGAIMAMVQSMMHKNNAKKARKQRDAMAEAIAQVGNYPEPQMNFTAALPTGGKSNGADGSRGGAGSGGGGAAAATPDGSEQCNTGDANQDAICRDALKTFQLTKSDTPKTPKSFGDGQISGLLKDKLGITADELDKIGKSNASAEDLAKDLVGRANPGGVMGMLAQATEEYNKREAMKAESLAAGSYSNSRRGGGGYGSSSDSSKGPDLSGALGQLSGLLGQLKGQKDSRTPAAHADINFSTKNLRSEEISSLFKIVTLRYREKIRGSDVQDLPWSLGYNR